jgi:hypothetical protein
MKCRYLVTCPNCGVTADSPARDDVIKLHLLPEFGLRLTAIDQTPGWTASLLVESFDRRIRAWIRWPKHLLESSNVVGNLLNGYAGYVSISVFILNVDGQLRVLSQPVNVATWKRSYEPAEEMIA